MRCVLRCCAIDALLLTFHANIVPTNAKEFYLSLPRSLPLSYAAEQRATMLDSLRPNALGMRELVSLTNIRQIVQIGIIVNLLIISSPKHKPILPTITKNKLTLPKETTPKSLKLVVQSTFPKEAFMLTDSARDVGIQSIPQGLTFLLQLLR